MTAPPIAVNGETLIPTTAGALCWPAQQTLIVSDLHFEKGSHFATRGVLLPPYDTRTTLRRLAALITAHRPVRVISLGDAFHDGGAEARMDGADAEALGALTGAAEWLWILGNHDPEPPKKFAGRVERCARLGRLVFRHEPSGEAGEIAGHLHPVARVRAETHVMRRRCYAVGGERLVMPAFGAYTGGLNVLDPAFAPPFADLLAFVIGGSGVYAFARHALLPEAPSAQRARSA